MSSERTSAGLIRSEIEEKRQRVAKLRERRKEQQQQQQAARAATVASSGASPTAPAPATATTTSSRGSSRVDALLASIPGLILTPHPAPVTPPAAPLAATASAPSTATAPPSPTPQQPQQPPVQAKPRPKLVIAQEEAIVDIVPRECLTYTRQTQTLESAMQPTDTTDTQQHQQAASSTAAAQGSGEGSPLQQPQQPPEGSKQQQEEAATTAPPAAAATLSQEEIAAIMASNEFQRFVARTGRIVERAAALSARFPDITADYLGDVVGATGAGGSQQASSRAAITPLCSIPASATPALQSRAVTCLAWSAQNPELLLAGFSAPTAAVASVSAIVARGDNGGDNEGLVLVWAIPNVLQHSEFTFTCQSAVMSAMFSPFQPQCIVGGTRSGQLVLWDMRAGQTPVLNRAPSKRTHTYPIYCLTTVDQSSSSLDAPRAVDSGVLSAGQMLASLSSDGRLCLWSLRNLAVPLETFDTQNTARATEVTAMAAPPYSATSFIVGGEDGGILTYNTRKMMGGAERAEGQQHNAPVLGLDFHPSSPTAAFDSLSRLFLSCSADWTIKLWTAAKAQSPARSLHTFGDLGDYVFGVQWSPVHPAAFASADGQGRLCLWDITRSLETPVECSSCGSPATCLRWNTAGSQIAVGDSLAGINVFSIGDVCICNISLSLSHKFSLFWVRVCMYRDGRPQSLMIGLQQRMLYGSLLRLQQPQPLPRVPQDRQQAETILERHTI